MSNTFFPGGGAKNFARGPKPLLRR